MMDFNEWRNWQSLRLKIPTSDIDGAEEHIAPHVRGYVDSIVFRPRGSNDLFECENRVADSIAEIGEAFAKLDGDIYVHRLVSREAIRVDGAPENRFVVTFAVVRNDTVSKWVNAGELSERLGKAEKQSK